MCVSEGLEPSLKQSGADRFRRWLTYLLWVSGDMSIRTINGSIIEPQDLRRHKGRLRPGMTADDWHTDTVTHRQHQSDTGEPRPAIHHPTKRKATSKRSQQPLPKYLKQDPEARRAQAPVPAQQFWEKQMKEARKLYWGLQPLKRAADQPEQVVHGWECGDGLRDLFTHILSHNIGPVGWRNSKPAIQAALDSLPAFLALQDIRLPKRYLKNVRRSLAKVIPNYHMLCSTRQVRCRDEETGQRKKYWVGVMTLVHKELQPHLEAIPLSKLGLGKDQCTTCEGRVLVTGFQKDGGEMVYNVNVYQYTSAHADKQQQLLRAVTTVLRHLKPKSTLIILTGDMNAAWNGERQGYTGDYTYVDNMLTHWIQSEGFQLPNRTYQHTWESPHGPQKSHLDYILTWRDGEVKYSTNTLISPHPSHDHHYLKARLGGEVLMKPSEAKKEIFYERLDFKHWSKFKDMWAALTASAVQEVQKMGLHPMATLTLCWERAHNLAHDFIGVDPKQPFKMVAYSNKTTRRLLKHLEHLRRALLEMERGQHSTAALKRAALLCTTAYAGDHQRTQMLTEVRARNRVEGYNSDGDSDEETFGVEGDAADPTLPASLLTTEEWAQQEIPIRARQIRERQKTLKKQYDKLIRTMQNTSIRQMENSKQQKLDMGGERELQSFMGKMQPMPSLWGVLPRSKARHYPWVLNLTPARAHEFLDWVGYGVKAALEKGIQHHQGGVFHMQRDGMTIHVFQHSAER
jgi:exonuclease III